VKMKSAAVGILSLLAVIGWVTVAGPRVHADANTAPPSITEVLSYRQLELSGVADQDLALIQSQGVTQDSAVRLAARENPSGRVVNVYVGKLTDLNTRGSSSEIIDRLVYVVQLNGVKIHVNGSSGRPDKGFSIATRYVYMVDALSGNGILGTNI
jgi:hypothetical protein